MKTRSRSRLVRAGSLVALAVLLCAAGKCPSWGALASPGLETEPIRTILFFAGEPLNGRPSSDNENDCPPPPGGNITQGCETAWPLDQGYLNWSDPTNRRRVVQRIVDLGFNTISMSTWGESWLPCSVPCPDVPRECCFPLPMCGEKPCCDHPVGRCTAQDGMQTCRIGWSGAAPTQLTTKAKDELFDAAVGLPVVIMPFIESRFDYDWVFRRDFPTSLDPRFLGQLAPGLISQVEDLISRYLKNPNKPMWRDKWAQVYDRNGEKRYAVVICQASSDSIGPQDDAQFAAAFDQVARRIYEHTQINVGFFLDPIPRSVPSSFGCPDVDLPNVKPTFDAVFRPDPDSTGPYLWQQSSILGIHAYSPEGWIDDLRPNHAVNECFRIRWKEDFSTRWRLSGVPLLQDVTPGYDGSKIFQGAPGLHGWGYDDPWRGALIGLHIANGQRGLVYNSWNGYCEGLAAMETVEQGGDNVRFIRALMTRY